MKNLQTMMISFYENKFSKSPAEISMYEVMEQVIKGEYASRIHTIRRYWEEGDKEAAQRLKGELPCFTASGTFDGAHAIRNLKQHTGIILIDFDHVEDLKTLREACMQDPHTLFAFRSPVDGYKVGVYVEGAERDHRRAYRMVSRYYRELTGVACDEACKDESRLCYLSYDPEGYVATLYEAFVLPEERKEEEVKNEMPVEMPVFIAGKEEGEQEVKTFVMSYLFFNPLERGKRNATLYKLACEACKRGYPMSAILRELLIRAEASDFPEKEIRQVLESGYKRVTGEGMGENRKVDPANRSDRVPECQYNYVENESLEEEAYWQGEELRRFTPCFADELFINFPGLLKEAIPEKLTDRERDLLLLSLLTAYSAILPDTTGTYNHKRFSPHLFTFGIAPAGSGKSIVQLAVKLIEGIHFRILQESEQQQQHYQVRKMEWQMECNRKLKKNEKINAADMPQEPPFRMLMLSATTSNSRMQMQLRDNGPLGGLLMDTEAQSLANANQLDCGHFDDMLCKAFEHETISSSFKINGARPIVIRSPRLAMLLTGTPEQLYKLIESPENGLLSRILIYTFREDPIWKEMTEEEDRREEVYEGLAQQAALLYQFCKNHPMSFNFSSGQWKRLNREFSLLLREVVTDGNDNLQAIVKRHGFMVMRIAMILTRLRKYEMSDTTCSVTCNDEDFHVAMEIVKCCYEHSRLVLTSMSSAQKHVLKDPNKKREFFLALPDDFTTEVAIKTGADFGLSRRTVMRMLAHLNGQKINRIDTGRYEKLK